MAAAAASPTIQAASRQVIERFGRSVSSRIGRSLRAKGSAAAGMSVPLVPLAGTAAAWGMLPFLAGALVALYWAIRRNMHDGRLAEEVRLWPDLITVVRREASGGVKRWHANPFWVRLRLFDGERGEKYLTLQGNGREIELGAFLSPGERQSLYDALGTALARLRRP